MQTMINQGIPTITEKGKKMYNNSTTIIKRNYIVEPEEAPLQEMIDSIKSNQSPIELNNKLSPIKKEEAMESANTTQSQDKTKDNEQSIKKEEQTPSKESRKVYKKKSPQKPIMKSSKTMRTKLTNKYRREFQTATRTNQDPKRRS